MNILRSYAYLFGRYRRRYVVGLLALAITNLIYMSIPRLLGGAVDALDRGATRAEVVWFAGAIVIMALAQAGFRVVSRVYVLGASRRVEYDLKGMLHDHLVKMAPSFYEAVSTGDLMSRMTNDVTLVRALGGPGILYTANALFIYLLATVFMAAMSWKLTLVVLAPLPLMAWVVRGLVHRLRAYALASRQALSDLSTVVQENLTGAQVVRSFALEQAQTRRFGQRSNQYVDWSLKESWTRAQMIPLIALAGGLSYVGVLGMGGTMVASGTVTLGDLVAFLSYVTMMIFPTVALGWIMSLLQRGAAALERLDDVLRSPETIKTASEARPCARGEGHVQVRGLTFRYGDALEHYSQLLHPADSPQKRRPALLEVELEARRGEMVALVGRVGSGKSTLLKALVRLVEIPGGRVWLDGEDITTIDLRQLREIVSYVPQDDFLFSTTARDNIAFGVPSADDQAVLAASLAAGLDPEREGLSAGLDTPVGERGSNLSGGQRQRVALARALLREAPVLLLDNALSNVDAETERGILEQLIGTGARRTVLVASNRITAIRNADRVYVFEHGRIVDAGTHDELITRPGLYRLMHQQQRLSARLEQY